MLDYTLPCIPCQSCTKVVQTKMHHLLQGLQTNRQKHHLLIAVWMQKTVRLPPIVDKFPSYDLRNMRQIRFS